MVTEMPSGSPEPDDYRSQYDEYWSSADRVGESSCDPDRTAEQVLRTCGLGNTLDIGCGEGLLVAALLRQGVDARGIDVSGVVVSRCNSRIPGRFTVASALSLPFDDEAFQTVVSTDCLEHLAPQDVTRALQEMHRVSRRNVFLRLATTPDRDGHWHLTIEQRAWWEMRCLEAGFRKHPRYYGLNPYESLNADGWQIAILLEKLPAEASSRYPLAALEEERGLHMDMLRDIGERSDAHVVRYQWASGYVRPGDRILDAACGLGYGSHVMRSLTQAASVRGIDESESAIDYAEANYSVPDGTVTFVRGALPDAFSGYEEGSFDVVVCFETLEHLPSPERLVAEFARLLSPGGRLIVSVPNDWSDESGEDPNPHHQQVYTWSRLRNELSQGLLLESAFAQTASRCKVAREGHAWRPAKRLLRQVDMESTDPPDCEWCLMTAMKSPLADSLPYVERAFANVAATAHESVRYFENYSNPWLMHAMVNSGYRLRSAPALARLAEEVIDSAPPDSNDALAALCVMAYRILESGMDRYDSVEGLIARIAGALRRIDDSPMHLRWTVSLLFAMASLQQALGRLEEAKATYLSCASHDVRAFGIHLATKSTEALYLAGKIAYGLGNSAEACAIWRRGTEYGEVLLGVSLDDILMNRDFPNRFDQGDGVREYALAWDSLAKCANGIHLVRRGGDIDVTFLEASFSRNLQRARRNFEDQIRLADTLQDSLVERTRLLQVNGADLRERTEELVRAREVVRDRTLRLEATVKSLAEKSDALANSQRSLTELSATAQGLEVRLRAMTGEIDALAAVRDTQATHIQALSGDLKARTEDLVSTRAELADRTTRLEKAGLDLEERTRELVMIRNTLRERTERLEAAADRIRELENLRSIDRGQAELAQSLSAELKSRTDELVGIRADLVDRSMRLDRSARSLIERTAELVANRDELRDRTERLEAAVGRIRELELRLEQVGSRDASLAKAVFPGTGPSKDESDGA